MGGLILPPAQGETDLAILPRYGLGGLEPDRERRGDEGVPGSKSGRRTVAASPTRAFAGNGAPAHGVPVWRVAGIAA